MIAIALTLLLATDRMPPFLSGGEPSAPTRYRALPERQSWLRCERMAAERLVADPSRRGMLRTFWPIQSSRLLFIDLDEDNSCQSEFETYRAMRDRRLNRNLRAALRNDDWNDLLLLCAQVIERRHLHRDETNASD